MTVEDRSIMVRRLREDLIGPFKENEILVARPSDVYLTGILWPKSIKMNGEDDERLDISSISGEEGDGSSCTGEIEEVIRSRVNRPSTAGISFAVASIGQEPILELRITFAIYIKKHRGKDNVCNVPQPCEHDSSSVWQRQKKLIEISTLEVGPSAESKIRLEKYGAPAYIYLHRRIAPWGDNWLVTLTLVNGYQTDNVNRDIIEENSIFQVRIEVYPSSGTQLIARPSKRIGLDETSDEEDRSTALLYRNSLEYAVGHTCSAEWEEGEKPGVASMVATTWIPRVLVPATSPSGHLVFNSLNRDEGLQPLSSLWLYNSNDQELVRALLEIPSIYAKWIELQNKKIPSIGEGYIEQATRNLENCRMIRDRITECVTIIGQNHDVAEAFRLANYAIFLQHSWDPERSSNGPFKWRPFQLGFILLTIPSIANRSHVDRNTMDLLWFPTGGGKTEAYLGLIAFLAFYRRLSSGKNPDDGDGVAAMMRYTLRLLTTQQFVRASAVILACEAIRRGVAIEPGRFKDLGTRPFSIGLWVGKDATPNNYEDALKGLQGGSNSPTPAQLVNCPSCRSILKWYPFEHGHNKCIRVCCENPECILHAEGVPLPVYTVDTDIYRERPTLLIGTVDKFAQIPRRSEINSLFSIHRGYPPDLIVQDELHLISGPLGTLVGLYEVAIDMMFTRKGKVPKIIGSTATIRRANEQVNALFNRKVCQFPPSAIDADDSGFAVIDLKAPGRLYAGVTTAGRSAKFTLQAVASSLLQSANADLTPEGRDNYWTMVSYFNSLRELGGALVLMQDDVSDSMDLLADKREESRRSMNPPEELTSRLTQAEVRRMLDRLGIHAGQDDALDIVLATNMLSVGVDIPRLGLMIVNGQPKGISEYIQATSRIGRGRVPGLVVAMLNNAKPRDRSHYESFTSWHRTLYRDVEATSVTPFAPRARDRGLHAVLVSLIRHLIPEMLNGPNGFKAETCTKIETIVKSIIDRSNIIDKEETAIASELISLLKQWRDRNPVYYWRSNNPTQSLLQDAENTAVLRSLRRSEGEAWATMNNLRSVEPSTRFRLAEALKVQDLEGSDNGR